MTPLSCFYKFIQSEDVMFIGKMQPSRRILIAGALLIAMILAMSLFAFAEGDVAGEEIVEAEAAESAEAVEEAAAEEEDEAPTSRMFGTFWSLVPPVIAIVLALITKEVYSSLFIGVLAGGLFASNFSFAGTLDALISDGFITAVADNAGIFLFLVILGTLVVSPTSRRRRRSSPRSIPRGGARRCSSRTICRTITEFFT